MSQGARAVDFFQQSQDLLHQQQLSYLKNDVHKNDVAYKLIMLQEADKSNARLIHNVSFGCI